MVGSTLESGVLDTSDVDAWVGKSVVFAEVVEEIDSTAFGMPAIGVRATMTTQTGEAILRGTGQVKVPT